MNLSEIAVSKNHQFGVQLMEILEKLPALAGVKAAAVGPFVNVNSL